MEVKRIRIVVLALACVFLALSFHNYLEIFWSEKSKTNHVHHAILPRIESHLNGITRNLSKPEITEVRLKTEKENGVPKGLQGLTSIWNESTTIFTKAPVLKVNPNRKTPLSHGLNYPLMINIKGLVHQKINLGQEINETPINPHPFKYINRPPNCTFEKEIRGLIILVKSKVTNFHLRRGIRDTWGNVKDVSNTRVVFILGFASDNSTQWIVQKEMEQYNDLIQEDFIDNYYNNTYKTIMAFNWAVTFCSSAKFLFFVDDDYLILLPNLIEHVDSIHPGIFPKIFQGHLVPHSRPFDEKSSKWYVTTQEYPHDFYPPYLAGGAYLVSMEVAVRFQLAFPYVKYFKIDDSYLGIVAKKLSIRPSTFNQFFIHRGRIMDLKYPKFISTHGFKNPESLLKFWRPLHNAVAPKLLKARKSLALETVTQTNNRSKV